MKDLTVKKFEKIEYFSHKYKKVQMYTEKFGFVPVTLDMEYYYIDLSDNTVISLFLDSRYPTCYEISHIFKNGRRYFDKKYHKKYIDLIDKTVREFF